MESNHHQASLFEPLLLPTTSSLVISSTTATTTPSNVDGDRIKTIITSSSNIVFRFACIILIGTISLWANYEASKGFTISIINDAGDSFAGKRFTHFYISDDKATRIVFDTSKYVENILYPSDHDHVEVDHHQSHFFKKRVNHVILRLASQNMSTDFSVESRANNEYVLHLNPSIMKHENFKHAIVSAIQRGMARIWLWDGYGTVPESIMNGMIEYISNGCKPAELMNSSKNSLKTKTVAEMLVNCLKQNSSFVRQLNQVMRDHWQDSTFDVKTHANFCHFKFNNY